MSWDFAVHGQVVFPDEAKLSGWLDLTIEQPVGVHGPLSGVYQGVGRAARGAVRRTDMSSMRDRRGRSEVLARARILSLVSTVAEGFPAEELISEVGRFDLGDALTADEAAWLEGTLEPGVDVAWQVEAMLALAWTLGLAPALGDRDPESYGPVQIRLQDESAEGAIAERPEGELTEMLAHIEAVEAAGEEPPPHERYGPETLRWRRAALQWVLDRSLGWPP